MKYYILFSKKSSCNCLHLAFAVLFYCLPDCSTQSWLPHILVKTFYWISQFRKMAHSLDWHSRPLLSNSLLFSLTSFFNDEVCLHIPTLSSDFSFSNFLWFISPLGLTYVVLFVLSTCFAYSAHLTVFRLLLRCHPLLEHPLSWHWTYPQNSCGSQPTPQAPCVRALSDFLLNWESPESQDSVLSASGISENSIGAWFTEERKQINKWKKSVD